MCALGRLGRKDMWYYGDYKRGYKQKAYGYSVYVRPWSLNTGKNKYLLLPRFFFSRFCIVTMYLYLFFKRLYQQNHVSRPTTLLCMGAKVLLKLNLHGRCNHSILMIVKDLKYPSHDEYGLCVMKSTLPKNDACQSYGALRVREAQMIRPLVRHLKACGGYRLQIVGCKDMI